MWCSVWSVASTVVNGDFNNDITVISRRKSVWLGAFIRGIINAMLAYTLFLTGAATDAMTTNRTHNIFPTTMAVHRSIPPSTLAFPHPPSSASSRPRRTLNCRAWSDAIAAVKLHPDMNLTCRTNAFCTGFGCKGRYSNAMHAIDYELCFGTTIRPCQNPVDVFVFFNYPVQHSNYGRPFEQTIPQPISLPRSRDGDIQSHMQLTLRRSVAGLDSFLHIDLTIEGHNYISGAWEPDLTVSLVNKNFKIPRCNRRVPAPLHLTCDVMDSVDQTTTPGLPPGRTRIPAVTTPRPTLIAYQNIIIVVVIVIMVAVCVYLCLRIRRQKAKKLCEADISKEDEKQRHGSGSNPDDEFADYGYAPTYEEQRDALQVKGSIQGSIQGSFHSQHSTPDSAQYSEYMYGAQSRHSEQYRLGRTSQASVN